jgi:hypothetical protein
MAEDILIARIKKSSVSEVWVVAREYNGRPLCDIREYFHPADNPEWLPTKKGATVPSDLLVQVVDAVEAMATRDAVGEVREIPRGKKAKLRVLRDLRISRHEEIDDHIYRIASICWHSPHKLKPAQVPTLLVSVGHQSFDQRRVLTVAERFHSCNTLSVEFVNLT